MSFIFTNLFIESAFLGSMLTFEVKESKDKAKSSNNRQNDDSNKPDGSIRSSRHDIQGVYQRMFTNSIKVIICVFLAPRSIIEYQEGSCMVLKGTIGVALDTSLLLP